MTTEKTTLEVIASTVEEATAKGLAQLGLPASAVDIEVLDSGSRGLFGLGGRQARIRLVLKDITQPIPAASQPEPVVVAATPVETTHKPNHVAEPTETMDPASAESARQVVSELLEKMKVQAQVTAHWTPPQDEKDRAMVVVEVQGQDLSILIGRQSETLNALQYITSLIVSKEVGHWVPLLIDIQGYRSRRERQLRQLARRMAEQVIQYGRRQVLEPMPASERRIIHLELRDHPQVTTESEGEEPTRKVVILPKKQ
ncbi:MAG TPA: RNA-binding cell elongation regulator Jag/EloR [Anaerolineaceae bacterium]|nr:RNA-binding cell elongation regulator Jag/EloR [Anaerolineaceae bacterium]HNS36147.1 RNA-binding cell elongation regulator Jag/EloR [Anaerolineaceae bacterium]